jgi:DNA-3-methyladenine glycosylase II
MLIHLDTQADLEEAIHALVKQDPRLKPIFELAGMPALRRREPGYAGLAAIICGQQLSTASASAIWARVSAAFDPFHHDACAAPASAFRSWAQPWRRIKTLKIQRANSRGTAISTCWRTRTPTPRTIR